MQLSDLIRAIQFGRNDAEISFCDLGCRCCHILERSCNRACDRVEQPGEENEGEEQPCYHCPFQGVHIGEHLCLRHEEDERPACVADRVDGVVVVDILIAGFKEERLLRKEAFCCLLALLVDVVVHCQHRMADKASLVVEQEGGTAFADLEGGDGFFHTGEGDIHPENCFRSVTWMKRTA